VCVYTCGGEGGGIQNNLPNLVSMLVVWVSLQAQILIGVQ